MARPKTKSALVDGMTELVDSLRSIESKLNTLLKNKTLFGPKRGRGRPVGSYGKTTNTDKLHSCDFYFFRAVIEQIDAGEAADRYLAHRGTMDKRTAVVYARRLAGRPRRLRRRPRTAQRSHQAGHPPVRRTAVIKKSRRGRGRPPGSKNK